MTVTGRSLDQDAISRLSTSFAEARLLQTAVELGVFEFLAHRPATRAQLGSELGLHPRLGRDFFNSLVALGLLERTDDDLYRNSPPAQQYLVPGGTVFLGGRIRTAAQRHYHSWGRLSELLREGHLTGDGDKVFDRLYTEPERARTFFGHMDANNALVAQQLTEQIDWSGYRSFVDVGGARGNVAAVLATAHPHLRGGVFELPGVEPFFDELMAERGLAGDVTFYPGDFFADPLPAADVLIFGHVLHDWPAERCRELLQRAHDTLRPGGAVLIYDQMLDEHDPDLRSLIGSLNVALMTAGGSEYTVADCRGWVEQAGLRVESVLALPKGNDSVLLARRPA